MKYLDKKGSKVFVSTGLGSKYGTFRKSKNGGLHRVKSPAMPMVESREEAEKNLKTWAEKNELKSVN
ncbi:hypothetical protein [Clostridium sp. AWRP]|uniref:hypothetical protein n=1 Tax=Clostridium sp. AWRP TaxID=2212991 RepID=UPI001FAAE060|nr:hypothetical protein [Clostridium sp. AWRP]